MNDVVFPFIRNGQQCVLAVNKEDLTALIMLSASIDPNYAGTDPDVDNEAFMTVVVNTCLDKAGVKFKMSDPGETDDIVIYSNPYFADEEGGN